MDRIESKVRNARRRLVLGLFGRALSWTLFAGLLVALLASFVPALWAIEADLEAWIGRWLGGSLLAALAIATLYAAIKAPSLDSVAAEVDRRFGLRERLSSAVAIRPEDRDSEFGQALLADAERRAGQLVISEAFPLRLAKVGWLPALLLPLLGIAWVWVEPVPLAGGSRTQIDAAEIRQVKAAAEELKKRISQQRRKAEAEGIEESRELFQRVEAELDDITRRKDLNRKQAMVAMNDLKKQLEQRREELGSPEQIRKAMSQMKDFESGPAEQVAKSMEKGEFGKAQEALQKLARQLRDGQLSDQERQQLQEQITKMQQQLEQSFESHEQKKQDLQQQIEQARSEGRSDDAAEMQRQHDQLCQQDGQMGSMGAMADALAKAAGSMQQGNSGEAADSLDQIAGQLGDLQQELSQLQEMDSALGDLADSKNQMRCGSCTGGGCQQCQGGPGSSLSDTASAQTSASQGSGIGRGTALGSESESELDSQGYESQVRGDMRQGRAVVAGTVDGPNRKGVTREDLSTAIEAALADDSDPLENQTLPRIEREQAQQYFDRLRDGSGS